MEIKSPYIAFAKASGAVSSTSLALTASPFSFTAAQMAAADGAIIQATAQPCSLAFLGADAVAGDFTIAAGESFAVYGNTNVNNLRLIRTGGTDSTVLIILLSS